MERHLVGFRSSTCRCWPTATISQRRAFVIHGEKASRHFGEDAFRRPEGRQQGADDNPRASHVDLYDNLDVIPFDRIEAFYREYLK